MSMDAPPPSTLAVIRTRETRSYSGGGGGDVVANFLLVLVVIVIYDGVIAVTADDPLGAVAGREGRPQTHPVWSVGPFNGPFHLVHSSVISSVHSSVHSFVHSSHSYEPAAMTRHCFKDASHPPTSDPYTPRVYRVLYEQTVSPPTSDPYTPRVYRVLHEQTVSPPTSDPYTPRVYTTVKPSLKLSE